MRNALLTLFALLTAVCSMVTALEISDIHLPMKRDEADATLSKDYTYAVMTDGSVRRTWSQGDKDIIIDFDTVSNDAIMVAIVYHKPVAKKTGIADAHALAAGKFDENATWEAPKDREAKALIENTYGLKNARRKKLEDKSMLFYETNEKSRIVRVSLFANMPHTNRWALSTLTKNSGKTAMGNQMSAGFISSLYEDEERRQGTDTVAQATPTEEPADTAPTFTVTVTRRSEPAPAKPAEPTPAPTTPAPARTATAATSTPTATPPATPAKPTGQQLEPGRHTMSLLPPPPDWLKKIGVEEPTWWHYLGVGIVLLLIIVFIIHSMSQSASRSAQRKRFANVVAQAPQSKNKIKR